MEKLYKSVSISESEELIFSSEIVKKDYKIFIAEPITKYKEHLPCSVLYLLDANIMFCMAVEIIRLLNLTGELPPILVVGIGYDEEEISSIANRRLQEFTPTKDPGYKRIWNRSYPLLSSDGGGGLLFLEFINDELKPFIGRRYHVDPNSTALAGNSLGGLFALNTLFQKPDSFSRYIIGSPVIFWDNYIIWSYESFCASENSCLKAKVFLGVGGLEDDEPYQFPEEAREELSYISYVDDTRKMYEKIRLRGYEGVDVSMNVFEGETHMSVIAPWLSRGLRSLFST